MRLHVKMAFAQCTHTHTHTHTYTHTHTHSMATPLLIEQSFLAAQLVSVFFSTMAQTSASPTARAAHL